jgi:RecB family exonuclease
MRLRLLSAMTILRFTLTCVQDVSSFSTSRVLVLPSCHWNKRTISLRGGRRPFSVAQSASTIDPPLEDLKHPEQFGKLPMPKALSPSAVMEFKKCPQSFLFQYLYKLRQPTSLALAKGSMCHEALEKVFELEPKDRSLENLQNLLRVSWGQKRLSDTYRFLFEDETTGDRNVPAEREWGQSALQLLDNYYRVEDPKQITRPNPMKREVWLNAHLTLDPSLGTTGTSSSSPSQKPETFHVRGIVDRLDMVRTASRQTALKIVDYKTGKAPNLKYSRPVNERIAEENFYQLKIYALLLREKGAGKNQPPEGMDLRYLQLLYLTSEAGPAKPWDYDLGETQEERDEVLQDVHQDLSNVWTSIGELVAQQDPKAFVGCDRSFCYCHKCRERFVPGTLWEPN